jgi:hypothetical protein
MTQPSWHLLLLAAAVAIPTASGCDSASNGATSEGAAPAASISAPKWNATPADASRLLGLWVAGDRSAGDGDEKSLRMEQGIAECTMQFDFRAAGEVFIQLGRDVDVEQGRWELVSTQGPALIVKITAPSCGEREFRVELVGDNRFTISPADATDDSLAFTLTRIRGAS